MKFNALLLTAVAAILFGAAGNADAQISTLGNGYSCASSRIVYNHRLVSLRVARSRLAQTISQLRRQIQTASKNERARLQAKLARVRATRSALGSCVNGDFEFSTAVDPLFSSLPGIYAGTYSLHGSVLSVGGLMQMTFALHDSVLSGNIQFQLLAQFKDSKITGTIAGSAYDNEMSGEFVVGKL